MQEKEKDRTQLIRELQTLRQEVEAISARYNSLFEGAGDSILIVDAETFVILEANTNTMRQGY